LRFLALHFDLAFSFFNNALREAAVASKWRVARLTTGRFTRLYGIDIVQEEISKGFLKERFQKVHGEKLEGLTFFIKKKVGGLKLRPSKTNTIVEL